LYVEVECECGDSLRVIDLTGGSNDIVAVVKACEGCIEAAKDAAASEERDRCSEEWAAGTW
jgi:hypothetical protein